MKILTICEGGNVRSVALAFILKDQLGHDAIAMSWRRNSLKTKKMLFKWADKIVLMEDLRTKTFEKNLPKICGEKIQVLDVGQDQWYNPMHPDLQRIILSRINELNLKS